VFRRYAWTSRALALHSALAACGINPAFNQTSDTTDATADPSSGAPDTPTSTSSTSSAANTTLPDPTTTTETSGGLDATNTDDGTSTSTTSTTSTIGDATTGDATTGTPLRDCPVDDALIACYPFPAQEYAILVDGSGNGRHGTLADINLQSNPLGYGQAVEFYSDNSRATVPYDEAFTVDELTVAAFVFVKSEHKAIVDKHGQYAMFVEDGQASCILRGGNGMATIAKVNIPLDEQWIHLACTYNGEFLTIYVASKAFQQASSMSHAHGIDPVPESDLAIGRDHPEDDFHFIGMIDHVLVYGRALASDEVCALADPLCP
jgi:hypothetical protein